VKIGIDARFLGRENSGLGRYTKNLLEFLQKIDKKNQYFTFLRPKVYKIFSPTNKNFKKILANFVHYSLKEQMLFPFYLYRNKLDLMHFLHFNLPVFYFKPYIITIHDLTKHAFLGPRTTTRLPFIYWPKQAIYYIVFWLAVKRAKKIITPSNFVKNEIIKTYHVREDKIKVIHEAVDKSFFVQSKKDKNNVIRLFKKHKIRTPYLVYTGNLYLHKNVEIILNALKSFPRLFLAILCPRDVFSKRFKKTIKIHKLQDRISFILLPSDQEMKLIYQKATALVQPSLSEGFGLTGLEAMASRLPVIAARTSCLPEIYGDAAIYFDPTNKSDLVKKIKLILKLNKLERKKIIDRGVKQVKKYSWQKTAQQTIKTYYDIELVKYN